MSCITKKSSVAAIGFILLFVLISGCQEQQAAQAKQVRLLANENTKLNQMIEQRDMIIDKQKEQLDECAQEKTIISEKATEDAKSLLQFLIEENKKLEQQVSSLQAEIAKLKEVQ